MIFYLHLQRSSGNKFVMFLIRKSNYCYCSCCPGDGGIASSVPSQGSLASSSSLDFFDPLPSSTSGTNPTRKTPESFLGPNAALVNLDSLVTKPAQPAPAFNPFLASTGGKIRRCKGVVFKHQRIFNLIPVELYLKY